MIRLDVAKRSIDLLVEAAELEQRRAALAPPARRNGRGRGYAHLFNETILQADEGCDFDFMRGEGEGVTDCVRITAVMPANAGIQYSRGVEIEPISRGVLDHPPRG